jgi:hypothetical protein
VYRYLISALVLLLVLLGWAGVQRLAVGFARRHLELGPYPEADGCGFGCGHCAGQSCSSQTRDPP